MGSCNENQNVLLSLWSACGTINLGKICIEKDGFYRAVFKTFFSLYLYAMDVRGKKMNFTLTKRGMALVGCMTIVVMLTGCGKENTNVELAMERIQLLDYKGALESFDYAVEEAENERLIVRGKGIAYMGLMEYEKSIECFRKALSASNGWVEPFDYDVNYYLATAYIKNGQYEKARKVYDAILALNSDENDARFLRGVVLLELNEYDAAKADFESVLKNDPKNYDRLIQIYQELEHYGYQELGQEYLRQALENDDKGMTAYDKGRIYYYQGEFQKAYLMLEEAREKGDVNSFLYLGKSYEATGDYNYASSVYKSYLANDTGNAEIYNQLGICEMAKKEYLSALEAFQTGKNVENNDMMQTLSYNEIVAYEYLGEYEKATVLLEEYLELYPDDEKAIREYEFLKTR